MKFFNFHLMPYAHADLKEIGRLGTAWVTYPNSHYDPEKGVENEEIESMLQRCGVEVPS